SLAYYGVTNYWADIVPLLKKHSDSIIKLCIKGEENHWPLSFIKDFINLQELDLTLIYENSIDSDFGHFKDLQHFIFPHLKILNRGLYLSGKELLETVAKHLPKNFHELKLHDYYAELDSKDLESFFINWKNRKPRKLLTLIFKDNGYKNDDNNDNENEKNYEN